MEEEVRKEILYDLGQAIKILQTREKADTEQLGKLSDHAIEDVAVHKDLDLISATVLLYSLYKISNSLNDKNYQRILKSLQAAEQALQQPNLGKYNRHIKDLFEIVRSSNAKIKLHLQDVLDAARIKKGSTLLEHGLSIGQAAGLMGLSNWDLQQYASKTTALQVKDESMTVKKRLQTALKIFGVS